MLSGCTKLNNKTENLLPETENTISMLTSPKGADQVAVSKTGIYYTENDLLNFYDYESKIQTPLCSDSACKHNGNTCTAKIESSLSRIFLNKNKDKLFYNYIDETTNQYNTVVEDLDGANKKIIDKRMTSPDSFLHIAGDNDSIYIISSDTFGGNKSELIKINFTTGESVPLTEFDCNTAKIIGAYERTVIVLLGKYNQDNMSIVYENTTFNTDTKQCETIDTYTYNMADDSVSNELSFVVGSNLYKFKDINGQTASLYKTDFITKEKTLISDNIPYFGNLDSTNVKGYFDNSVIIDMRQFKRNGASGDRIGRFVINLNDGTYKEVNLNMVRDTDEGEIFDPINVYEQYNEFLVVSYGIDYVDYITEGQSLPSKIGVPKYGLISIEDFCSSTENYKPIRYSN